MIEYEGFKPFKKRIYDAKPEDLTAEELQRFIEMSEEEFSEGYHYNIRNWRIYQEPDRLHFYWGDLPKNYTHVIVVPYETFEDGPEIERSKVKKLFKTTVIPKFNESLK